jgi:ATPase family protein associated with various cellular activities (AAA)
MPTLQPKIAPLSLVQHDSYETMVSVTKCLLCDTHGCCGNDIVFQDYEVDDYFEDLHNQGNRHILEPVVNPLDLKENQKVLFPCEVYGFALLSRSWAALDIDLVRDVEYADGWDNLVINRTIKETVLALVKNHARASDQGNSLEGAVSSVDLVRGKGKGLIILLHGEPGVGKTSTAECVADHTRRPLFPITCGDIGDNAESVEKNLDVNFQLAHKWGCVLLLDEAE